MQTANTKTIADGKPGALQRIASGAARIRRLVRRAYYHRSTTQRLDADQIEHLMICSLYRETAASLGLEVYELGRVLCIAGNGRRFRVWRTTSEFDHGALWAITEDKMLTKALFQERGLPVPEGRSFSWRVQDAAIRYACSLGRAVVVKPASDTCGGVGVTTGLTQAGEIRRAFRNAGLFATEVLIEEMIQGEDYRFLVYKGKCLSVLRRERPGVTGNGADTVRVLAELENQSRIRSADWRVGDPPWMPLLLDSTALRHLKRHGHDWSYVPQPGERVDVAGAANFGFGCTYKEVLYQTHPSQIRVAEEAANTIGMDLAGVDIISPDIGAPACQLIEINNAPGPEIHYGVRNPEAMTDPLRTILIDFFGLAGGGPVSRISGAGR